MKSLEEAAELFGIHARYNMSSGYYHVNVLNYIEATAGLSPRVKLVNMPLSHGEVLVDSLTLRKILSEKYKKKVMDRKVSDRVKDRYTGSSPNFPPCVDHIMYLLSIGVNLTHFQRFALTSFLLNIGWSVEDIVSLYQRSPDFNRRITSYFVNHIKRGGYTPPSCKTMKSNGCCIEDGRCSGVNHPLNFYQRYIGAED